MTPSVRSSVDYCTVIDLEAALGELGHEPAQGEVPLAAAPDQPVAMRAGDLPRLVAADLARRDGTTLLRRSLPHASVPRPGPSPLPLSRSGEGLALARLPEQPSDEIAQADAALALEALG